MKGWTPQGREVELTAWQEQAVRTLLNPEWKNVAIVRGRQWGWSTVMETARRYDLKPELLPPGDPAVAGMAEAIGPPTAG